MKFKSNIEEDFSLQLTPLVDVVFLLLIFFMVSTAFVDFTRQLEIELPTSHAGAAVQKKKVLTIEISAAGNIFLDGKPVAAKQLGEKLSNLHNFISAVIIRADKKLDYGVAVQVMGICKAEGIENIGLLVTPK